MRYKRAAGFLPLLIATLALMVSGCVLTESIGLNSTLPPTITLVQLPTQTQIQPTTTSSPTISPSPSSTVEPTETIEPTQRSTWTPRPSNTQPPTWTPSITSTSLPPEELGVILTEDFSSGTGWKIDEGSNWELGFGDGDYRMLVEEPYVEITSTRDNLKFADTRIAADIRYSRGDGYYGFSCRESSSAYYILFITSDGQYGVGERRNDGLYFFQLAPSDAIETGKNSENRVVAECLGDYLSLTVNDKPLISWKVEGIGSGWVSMMIGTREAGELEVFYDNLIIWGPLVE